MLVWKTNFDTTAPFVDSTNTASNKFANERDLGGQTLSRISSASSAKEKNKLTILKEKAYPETSDERKARKVSTNSSVFEQKNRNFSSIRSMYSMERIRHVRTTMVTISKLLTSDLITRTALLE